MPPGGYVMIAVSATLSLSANHRPVLTEMRQSEALVMVT